MIVVDSVLHIDRLEKRRLRAAYSGANWAVAIGLAVSVLFVALSVATIVFAEYYPNIYTIVVSAGVSVGLMALSATYAGLKLLTTRMLLVVRGHRVRYRHTSLFKRTGGEVKTSQCSLSIVEVDIAPASELWHRVLLTIGERDGIIVHLFSTSSRVKAEEVLDEIATCTGIETAESAASNLD
ncbi:hypothetical protein [Aeoliella sp. SH292]|uniref:hypothetical protein n=1 Tax=Aeoliella sp. SH292 TaxID=3454464 RepID=UPI003F9AA6E6